MFYWRSRSIQYSQFHSDRWIQFSKNNIYFLGSKDRHGCFFLFFWPLIYVIFCPHIPITSPWDFDIFLFPWRCRVVWKNLKIDEIINHLGCMCHIVTSILWNKATRRGVKFKSINSDGKINGEKTGQDVWYHRCPINSHWLMNKGACLPTPN